MRRSNIVYSPAINPLPPVANDNDISSSFTEPINIIDESEEEDYMENSENEEEEEEEYDDEENP